MENQRPRSLNAKQLSNSLHGNDCEGGPGREGEIGHYRVGKEGKVM